MSNKLKDDITDDEIDALFNSGTVPELKQEESKQSDIVPEEFSVDNKKSVKDVERSTYVPKETHEEKKEKREAKDDPFKKVKFIIDGVLKTRSEIKYKEQVTKNILNGLTKVNIDPSTQCNFHLYEVDQIMGDVYYCKCRYCSAYKEMRTDEWDEYCRKYRKWL